VKPRPAGAVLDRSGSANRDGRGRGGQAARRWTGVY